MSESVGQSSASIAVTVFAADHSDGSCTVVDTAGRAWRLPLTELDPRLVTLHPGQRLRVTVHTDGTVSDAGL